MDFSKIEEALCLALPDSYKAFFVKNPFAEIEAGDELSLIRDVQWLISENLQVRENTYAGIPWNDALFIFGRDGCGGVYFINLESNSSSIYFIHFEDHEGLDVLDDLEYVKNFVEYEAEIIQRNLDSM